MEVSFGGLVEHLMRIFCNNRMKVVCVFVEQVNVTRPS